MNLLITLLLSQWTITPNYTPMELRIMAHCWGEEYIDLRDHDYSFQNRLRYYIAGRE
jgi:hypothetical protein